MKYTIVGNIATGWNVEDNYKFDGKVAVVSLSHETDLYEVEVSAGRFSLPVDTTYGYVVIHENGMFAYEYETDGLKQPVDFDSFTYIVQTLDGRYFLGTVSIDVFSTDEIYAGEKPIVYQESIDDISDKALNDIIDSEVLEMDDIFYDDIGDMDNLFVKIDNIFE